MILPRHDAASTQAWWDENAIRFNTTDLDTGVTPHNTRVRNHNTVNFVKTISAKVYS